MTNLYSTITLDNGDFKIRSCKERLIKQERNWEKLIKQERNREENEQSIDKVFLNDYVKKTKIKRKMNSTNKPNIIMIWPFALAFFMTIATFIIWFWNMTSRTQIQTSSSLSSKKIKLEKESNNKRNNVWPFKNKEYGTKFGVENSYNM